jgi:hypothetical protein
MANKRQIFLQSFALASSTKLTYEIDRRYTYHRLALRFINHSNNFHAEYVCFILPQLFESDGKGVPRKRVKGFNLIHSEKIETNF